MVITGDIGYRSFRAYIPPLMWPGSLGIPDAPVGPVDAMV
jgi:hypothetical protein